ncbi:MAG: hypothetical protein ACRCZP_18080, partial [Phycicoccus sp.]
CCSPAHGPAPVRKEPRVSDLVQVAAPDSAVRAVRGMSGREYRSTDGMYRMTPAEARALRAEGGFSPSLGTPTSGGFACGCGFASLFRRCSRCGTTN